MGYGHAAALLDPVIPDTGYRPVPPDPETTFQITCPEDVPDDMMPEPIDPGPVRRNHPHKKEAVYRAWREAPRPQHQEPGPVRGDQEDAGEDATPDGPRTEIDRRAHIERPGEVQPVPVLTISGVLEQFRRGRPPKLRPRQRVYPRGTVLVRRWVGMPACRVFCFACGEQDWVPIRDAYWASTLRCLRCHGRMLVEPDSTFIVPVTAYVVVT